MNQPKRPNAEGGAGTPSCRPPCPDAAKTVSCEDCAEFLLDYIDGALPEDQRFKFDSHIAFCRDCEVYLENYRKAAAMTAGLGRDERVQAGAQVPKGLVEAILAARKRQGGDPHGQ
ncbi:MAG: zf-HC2 domain-containing protein [Phycisphaerales bacterium]